MAAEQKKLEVRPRNWWTPLALVILREERSYGYKLMERLKEFGFGDISAGTLYRTLRHMEAEGLCKSEWDASGSGPARRMYSITDAGEEYMAVWAEECKKYQKVLDFFYQAYTE